MFIFKNLAKIPIFTLPRLQLASFSRFNKAETLLKEFTPQMLQNSKNIKLLMKHTHIPGRIKRSQRGLFHKKRIQSGNRTCFSEKKSRRTWRPNIQKKRLESKILGKTLKLEVTTKMMKCMRKYGSFDNYILLTEPKNLDSIYGEYLRKLMLNKLNDPSFKIPYMNRSKKFVFKHRRSHYNMK